MSKPSPVPPAIPDLAQLHLTHAFFLDCVIRHTMPAPAMLIPADELHDLNLDFGLELRFDATEKYVELDPAFRLSFRNPAGEPVPLEGYFRLRFRFTVDNLPDLLVAVPEPPGLVPSADLILALASMSYSTARGMVIGKTAGTPFERLALPIIDAREFLARALAPAQPAPRKRAGVRRARPASE